MAVYSVVQTTIPNVLTFVYSRLEFKCTVPNSCIEKKIEQKLMQPWMIGKTLLNFFYLEHQQYH